ncbi:MAG: DNA repair protein RecO [Synergistetes bacterium]|nr:DNA repair protein RecO [Synergistota bacterium]
MILNRKVSKLDKLLFVFTREKGKLLVIAPGSVKLPNRFGGAIEPLNYGLMSIYYSVGSNFYLKEFDVKNSFLSVRGSLKRLRSSLSFFSLLNKLLPYEAPEAKLFDITLDFLNLLEEGSDPLLLELVVSLKAFDLLGFLPKLDTCSYCSGKISKEAFIKVEGPFLLCRSCSEANGLRIGAEGIALLGEIQKMPLAFFKDLRYNLKGLKEASLYLKILSEKVVGGVRFEFSGIDI